MESSANNAAAATDRAANAAAATCRVDNAAVDNAAAATDNGGAVGAAPFVQVRDIEKWYPHKTGKLMAGATGHKSWVKAVGGVSFDLARGEVLGVIGESGCGKSTLGRILCRLEEPTSGDVFIDGASTSDMIKRDFRAFRRTVQMIFQNPFDTFTPRDTIGEILVRPLKIHGIGANDEERRRMCVDALEKGGLHPAEDIMGRFPHELSGGQLQRVSIIRSMSLGPRLVVADEPVSMLDISVRADIINMLLDASRDRGNAMVFISHDIAITRNVSDCIAVMYLGRIVEYGRADDVVMNPRHPYTQALISNCASIDPDDIGAPIPIQGEPPTPVDPGPGCYFAPRCPKACERCRAQYPERVELGGGHYACCWFAAPGQADGPAEGPAGDVGDTANE